MRRSGMILVGSPLAIVFAVALTGTVAFAQRGQVAANQAVLTSMHGDVQVRHGTAGYQPARLNAVLTPNDGVKTGPGSRAEISVGGGGYVRMDQNSQILITALDPGGTTRFQALAGGIWVTIERALGGSQSFEVVMPSAVASVRGTVFRCEVSADGASETWVYEGEVEVQTGERRLRIAPDQRCHVGRNMQAVVDAFNLSGDDEAAWVMYNRHRDIVQHLGDPAISVALRERAMPEEGAFAASRAIAEQLALHGLRSTSIEDLEAGEFELRDDDVIEWSSEPAGDYAVIGDVTLEQVRQVNGGFSAVVSADLRLARAAEPTALTSISLRVPGSGADSRHAIAAALDQLGRRVGAGLAPRIIRELMQETAGAVRVDVSGGTREEVAGIRRALIASHGVLRTAPLVLPGQRISLAVVTDLSAQQLAQIIEERGGERIEQIVAGDRIVYVRLPHATPGGEAGRMHEADPPRVAPGHGQGRPGGPPADHAPRVPRRPMHR